MAVSSGRGVTGLDRTRRDMEGAQAAWRNLLWDSVRMLQAGRPDLAGRFRTAANEVERWLKLPEQAPHAAMRGYDRLGGSLR